MKIQWYPGHMTKARRMMEEDIRLIDLVIELVDTRIPVSSRNPDIDILAANKARLVLFNKADLADDKITDEWLRYFKDKGILALKLDSRNRGFVKSVNQAITEACADKIERNKKRGIIGKPIRAMVVGIPNVGKSTFINSLVGSSIAKTGNKPGVTKGKQWIRLSKNVELMDTPGILWPKFEDETVGTHLAMIGSINDEILDIKELCFELISFLAGEYPSALMDRYGLEELPDALEIMNLVGTKRGCLMKGGEIDLLKVSRLILEDYRSGRLGRISLERP